MSKTKISVFTPTRQRYDYLVRAMQSMVDTAEDLSRIEFMYAFDSDDLETMNKFKEYADKTWPDANMIYHVAPERYGWKKVHKYINDMADMATGDWFLIWSDDAIMHTREWDKIIEDKYSDKYCIVASKLFQHPSKLPMFPFMPRKWYELSGNKVSGVCGDLWIGTVSKALGILVEEDQIAISHFAMTSELHGSINHLFWGSQSEWQADIAKMHEHLSTLPTDQLSGLKISTGGW